MDSKDLKTLQARIGHTFARPALLTEALTHNSYAHEHRQTINYQRLEYLGDALIQFEVSTYLYRTYPQMKEGNLTTHRAAMVCQRSLADQARRLGLGDYVLIGKGLPESHRDADSLLCDLFESIVGALYIDGGYDVARALLLRTVLRDADSVCFKDYKTLLQNRLGSGADQLRYEVEQTEKGYYARAFWDDDEMGVGCGHNKKQAEQEAAKRTIELLDLMNLVEDQGVIF